MGITTESMLLRMLVSLVLGAAIGMEREWSGRPAGLRTHLLVSLASSTFMLVSAHFMYFQGYVAESYTMVDPSRIAASVVTGVGFLGGGAIMRSGMSVQGLTTAASLWLMAAIGMAAGAGMYVVAVIATLATLFCLVVLRRVEGNHWRLLQRRVTVVLSDQTTTTEDVLAALHEIGVTVADVDSDHNQKTNRRRLRFDVRLEDQPMLQRMMTRLDQLPSVRRVKVERTG